MSYAELERRLEQNEIVILDGGTGTELERRGVAMDMEAWCAPASLERPDVLVAVHRDFIDAGAEIITANTYASSRLMLEPAGLADRVEAVNRAAVAAALRARDAAGRPDVVVAGSLSHMFPRVDGGKLRDPGRSPAGVAAAFSELAALLCEAGCELILLEMMYDPDRMAAAFDAAVATGLPVWAGFSARQGEDGQVLSSASDRDILFAEVVQILKDYDVQAAGVMHSESEVTGEALAILAQDFDGPLTAYPDSGYFKMPNWQFQDIIEPEELVRFAHDWIANGVQVIGGCCGLTPEHIIALARLKERDNN